MILAAVGLNYSFLESKKVPPFLGLIAIVFLCVSSGALVGNQAIHVKPHISDGQLEAIEWMSGNTEKEAYVLTSNYDAPWALGWGDRKVIAPGLFPWNNHTEPEWFEFFDTQDLNTTTGFLNVYEGPLYIYRSQDRRSYLGLEKFENDYFEPMYNTREAVIYRYLRDKTEPN